MNLPIKGSRVLGAAFLLQFVTSFSSGVFLQPAWLVSGNIHQTLLNIAKNPAMMRANILVDMLTAMGIIFLGAILFTTLRKQNENIAVVAFGLYILEATLLAASRSQAFSLIGMSQEYVSTGQPASLQFMGKLALEMMNFAGSTLHMLVFCVGGILFYILLYQARVVPRALSLWGLITVFPCLAGTLAALFGYQVPFIMYLPYVPFELVIGVWILIKGIRKPVEVNGERPVSSIPPAATHIAS